MRQYSKWMGIFVIGYLFEKMDEELKKNGDENESNRSEEELSNFSQMFY